MTTPCLNNTVKFLSTIKRDDVKNTIKALWSLTYDADPILEPDYIGLTNGQVIMMKQVELAVKGDGASIDRLLDRMIGKPEQVNKNLNVQGTYKEFMEEVARQEGIIDVESGTTASDQ